MKYADVTPFHKKKNETIREDYQPKSILSKHSKIYQGLISNKSDPYFQKLFSRFHHGLCKMFSSKHCLLKTIENWHKTP